MAHSEARHASMEPFVCRVLKQQICSDAGLGLSYGLGFCG